MVLVLIAIFFSMTNFAEGRTEQKKWTFMVYLNADNNLDSFGENDLNEMATPACGSNSWRNVVVLIDRAYGPAELFYITAFGQKRKLENCGEIDMGDYRQLVKFVRKSVQMYPADHYSLVIWNHGSGWQKNKGEFLKGISYDDSSNNHITTAQLGLATNQIKTILGKNLDVLCFDACLMQMLEVAYAVKDSVDYINGAEETEPAEGYPYHMILGTWQKKYTRREFCEKVVSSYVLSYNIGGFKSTCHSTIDCSKIDKVIEELNNFCDFCLAGAYENEFAKALKKVQKFAYPTNIDLLHFISLLRQNITTASFNEVALRLETACLDMVVANGTSGFKCRNAKGIAIYFPENFYPMPDYLNLAFSKATSWDELIKSFQKNKFEDKLLNLLPEANSEKIAEQITALEGNASLLKAETAESLRFKSLHEQIKSGNFLEKILKQLEK
jgi:hypothetical protein